MLLETTSRPVQSPPANTLDESSLKAERARERRRLYYWENRDKIRQQQKEYYARQDKAKHAARIRAYRNRDKETTHAKRKAYRLKNLDRFRAWEKEYRIKHQEALRAQGRAYWHANRDKLLQKKREYNALNRDKRQLYYEGYKERGVQNLYENRVWKYKRNLNIYCPNSISKIRRSHPESVRDYMQRYPFEQYGEPVILHTLRSKQIFPAQGRYADCYDAGMMAYLYSIHRCAAMGYVHIKAYIRKVVPIHICCAAVIFDDAKALCKVNHFRLVQLDADPCNRY